MNSVTAHSPEVEPARAGQYLSFLLASEEYAVDILRVREIRGLCAITPFPGAPPHVQGVMNLRGAVVPVIDLRLALGLPRIEYGKFTVIVVLSVQDRTLGFVVDSVCDVVSLAPGDIEGAPELGARVDGAMVSGIARVQGRFVVLLDPDRVAAPEPGAR
jgi:purine-binding chemotaxis protein CheW